MPTRTQIVLCWILFTATMALLSVLLHAFVPPIMISLQSAFGVGPLGVAMLAVWLVAAYFVYRPLLAGGLARRSRARIRQR